MPAGCHKKINGQRGISPCGPFLLKGEREGRFMVVRTFLTALINDIGLLKNIHPCGVKRNFA